MRVARPGRLGAAVVISLLVSAIVGAITTGSVASRSNPVLAQAVSPFSCEAKDLLAFATFQASISQPTELTTPTRRAAPLAKVALRCAPLMPRSRAILAMAAAEGPARAQILLKAEQMNRREILLQGLVLQEHLANRDVGATTATLDRILRVHPAHEADFFPILVNALADFDGVDELAEVLDGSAPWHQRFLDHAVNQPNALLGLAALYPKIENTTERFDIILVGSLARAGSLDEAWSVYRRAHSSRREQPIDHTARRWNQQMPPFDWRYADSTGIRVQPSISLMDLQISILPGYGGILAQRTFHSNGKSLSLQVSHNIAPSSQLRNFRVSAECAQNGDLLINETLEARTINWNLPSRAKECRFIVLKITGRVFSFESPAHGEISVFDIKPVSI